MARRIEGDELGSIEERYERVRSVVSHDLQAAEAIAELFPRCRWATLNLSWWNIKSEDIERVSRPFMFAAATMRSALWRKIEALIGVAEQRLRYLPDDAIAPETQHVFAAYRELRALPAEPFAPRHERQSAHALALYELIAPNVPPARHRDVRPGAPAPLYNKQAMLLVAKLLEHYYGAPVTNIKSRLQAARIARDRERA